jgi:hypothetical protein
MAAAAAAAATATATATVPFGLEEEAENADKHLRAAHGDVQLLPHGVQASLQCHLLCEFASRNFPTVALHGCSQMRLPHVPHAHVFIRGDQGLS